MFGSTNCIILCNKKFLSFELEMHFLECQTQVDNGSQNKSQDSNPVIITIPQFQLPKLSELNQRPSGSKTLAVYKDGSFGFRCEICNKVLRDSWSLKVHFRTHTGDKPYKCDLCPKSFRQKSHLLKHSSVHLGGKKVEPYKCSSCDSIFFALSTLEHHKKLCKSKPVEKSEVSKRSEVPARVTKVQKVKSTLSETPLGIETSKNLPRILQKHCSKVVNNVSKVQKETSFGTKTLKDLPKVSVKGLNFRIVQSISKTMYMCSICQESTICLNSLSEHLHSHNQRSVSVKAEIFADPISPTFQCNNCDETFREANDFYTHWQQEHVNITEESVIQPSEHEIEIKNEFESLNTNLN